MTREEVRDLLQDYRFRRHAMKVLGTCGMKPEELRRAFLFLEVPLSALSRDEPAVEAHVARYVPEDQVFGRLVYVLARVYLGEREDKYLIEGVAEIIELVISFHLKVNEWRVLVETIIHTTAYMYDELDISGELDVEDILKEFLLDVRNQGHQERFLETRDVLEAMLFNATVTAVERYRRRRDESIPDKNIIDLATRRKQGNSDPVDN